MTVAVDVVDKTGLAGDLDAVGRLLEAVLEAEGFVGEVAVAFVCEASMAELNGRYRGGRLPTDVLAFDYAAGEDWPGTAAGSEVTGEVVVCPQVVIHYAGEDQRDPAAQLGWTLIHGALHLVGYDHETDNGEMRVREQGLLEEFDGLVTLLSIGSGCG